MAEAEGGLYSFPKASSITILYKWRTTSMSILVAPMYCLLLAWGNGVVCKIHLYLGMSLTNEDFILSVNFSPATWKLHKRILECILRLHSLHNKLLKSIVSHKPQMEPATGDHRSDCAPAVLIFRVLDHQLDLEMTSGHTTAGIRQKITSTQSFPQLLQSWMNLFRLATVHVLRLFLISQTPWAYILDWQNKRAAHSVLSRMFQSKHSHPFHMLWTLWISLRTPPSRLSHMA